MIEANEKDSGREQAQSDSTETSQPAWFDITIAGKRFNIASRYEEEHIRELERLLSETYAEVEARNKGQTALNVALLTALNLADQMVARRDQEQHQKTQEGRRIHQLIEGIDSVLYSAESP